MFGASCHVVTRKMKRALGYAYDSQSEVIVLENLTKEDKITQDVKEKVMAVRSSCFLAKFAKKRTNSNSEQTLVFFAASLLPPPPFLFSV
ncbi:hypothetical protein RIF29_15663 [Crotalaria pallida]|uniref:Uncharacterized protein n=1 Tax=Crotalaria pallida TaxID=3830 RepID=A0AAN9ICT0_CROPI